MKSGQSGQTDLKQKTLWRQINNTPDLDSPQYQRKRDLYLEAEHILLKKKYMEIIHLEHELGLNSSFNDLESYSQQLKSLKANKRGNLWLYLTINPKKGSSFFDFKPLLERFVKRKIIEQFFYCYEQRGQTENELGEGFHCHLLLKRSLRVPPNKFVRNAKNTFKKITNVNNPQIFHYRWCPQEYLIDKIAYISGHKNDEEKDLKCKMDTVWRLLHSLQPYYGEPPL